MPVVHGRDAQRGPRQHQFRGDLGGGREPGHVDDCFQVHGVHLLCGIHEQHGWVRRHQRRERHRAGRGSAGDAHGRRAVRVHGGQRADDHRQHRRGAPAVRRGLGQPEPVHGVSVASAGAADRHSGVLRPDAAGAPGAVLPRHPPQAEPDAAQAGGGALPHGVGDWCAVPGLQGPGGGHGVCSLHRGAHAVGGLRPVRDNPPARAHQPPAVHHPEGAGGAPRRRARDRRRALVRGGDDPHQGPGPARGHLLHHAHPVHDPAPGRPGRRAGERPL
mmetsp:Transcript_1304/g.5193  ORF Transcript_1304/g.5193 Transcript_1304/m.5193 type:complete len:274 (+) Transcript_1304:1179-2000(+)